MAQVWLVTGSSRGLGRAIVETGLAAGNRVLATARGIESLADLSERYGDQVKLFALDVTDEVSRSRPRRRRWRPPTQAPGRGRRRLDRRRDVSPETSDNRSRYRSVPRRAASRG